MSLDEIKKFLWFIYILFIFVTFIYILFYLLLFMLYISFKKWYLSWEKWN